MKQSTTYLLLCVLGIAAPWFFLVGFLSQPQPDMPHSYLPFLQTGLHPQWQPIFLFPR